MTARKVVDPSACIGVQMVADWIESLPHKTGKSLEQWIAIVKSDGPAEEKKRRDWLKDRGRIDEAFATLLGGRVPAWIVTLISFARPAIASSTELSTTS